MIKNLLAVFSLMMTVVRMRTAYWVSCSSNHDDYDDTGYIGDEKEMSMIGLTYNNYRTDYDFEAYREIHGYDFKSASKDFYDARLYLDYHF